MGLLNIEMLGSAVLREKAQPVDVVVDEDAPDRGVTPEVRTLIRDMFDTMYHAEGVGLAGPQVGVSLRLTVLDVPSEVEGERHVHALINPVIVESSSSTEKGVEGCLSIPGIEEKVLRPIEVVVEALTPDGDTVRIEADGLLARALQHELDHLDGVLFLDRLTPLKRELATRRWKRSLADAETS
ncbi:MAG: peptide deformylase [Longimicrobiales bacterium]